MEFNDDILSKKILYTASKEYKYFFKKCNVVGIGLGYKIKNGFYTCERCIKVFVSRKLSLNKITSKNLIPTLYKGIKTDVEDTGIIYSSSFISKIRPVLCGYSIGPIDSPFPDIKAVGTLGCLVTDGNHIYLLSNNHVLAYENKLSLGSHIMQPAFRDGGSDPKDTIGYLSKFTPLKFKTATTAPENFVDCAMAQVQNKSLVSSKIALVGKIKGLSYPHLNDPVKKVGRTSELTMGKITAIGVTLTAKYDFGELIFKNQISSNILSKDGDSGSIVLNEKNFILGLLFSGSISKSFFNPITAVLNSLDVSIVT